MRITSIPILYYILYILHANVLILYSIIYLAFPTIDLPVRAIEAAHAQGLEADALYCMELLEHTGIYRIHV